MMAGRAIAAIRSAFADKQPVLVFLAGPNGAGKSTFFRNFLEPHLAGRLPFVNADEIGKRSRHPGRENPATLPSHPREPPSRA